MVTPMYNNGALASTGALAASSLIMQSVWIFLAGFALLAAAVAVLRVLPRPAPRTHRLGARPALHHRRYAAQS